MNIFKCDICGAEIIHKPFNKLHMQREEGIWLACSRAPISIAMDVCDKCFREKLIEVLGIPKDCHYSESLDEADKAME